MYNVYIYQLPIIILVFQLTRIRITAFTIKQLPLTVIYLFFQSRKQIPQGWCIGDFYPRAGRSALQFVLFKFVSNHLYCM